jgi:hypothetical protein
MGGELGALLKRKTELHIKKEYEKCFKLRELNYEVKFSHAFI